MEISTKTANNHTLNCIKVEKYKIFVGKLFSASDSALNLDLKELEEYLSTATHVVLSEIEDCLFWCTVSKMLNPTVKIITTLPILQIGKHKVKSYCTIIKQAFDWPLTINDMEVEEFFSQLIPVNYSETVKLSQASYFQLVSSGFSLGSANMMVTSFSKTLYVLLQSSSYSFRYTKPLDKTLLKQAEGLFIASELAKASSLDKQIGELLSKLYDSVSGKKHTVLCLDALMLLDLVDLMIYKFPTGIFIFLVDSAGKPLIDYSNISHGFIDKKVHGKIYDFRLPFDFEELEKNSYLVKRRLPLL